MTVFYLLAVVTAAAVVAFGLWPLWRGGQRATAFGLMAVTAAAGVGFHVTTTNFDPELPTRASGPADVRLDLESRLERNPEDVATLRLLARWHMQRDEFADAVRYLERAYSASDGRDAEVMLDFAEALAAQDPAAVEGRAGQLVENALVVAPNNPRALWYGGSIAAGRGDRALAATRWEAMLRPDMPDDVRNVLTTRIAEMRGESQPAPAAPQPASEGTTLTAAVTVADELTHAVGRDAVLYLIAASGAGGPPVAVARYGLDRLPGELTVSDANAMIPGRTLSAQPSLVLTARVSQTGQPIAQPGDLYGETTVDPSSSEPLSILIDQVVARD